MACTFKKIFFLIAMSCLMVPHPSFGAYHLPTLGETELFTTLAKDCQDVDLKTWSHPTKNVWTQAPVPLERVQSCNGGSYIIYYATFPKDPTTFGHPGFFNDTGYDELFKGNNKHAYSIIDLKSKIIVYVKSPEPGRMTINYEQYAN